MVNIFNCMVNIAGFKDLAEFKTSLIHGPILAFTISFASLSATVEAVFGLEAITVFAFVIGSAAELISGISASLLARKEKLSSRKAYRWILKLSLWLIIIFMLHSFREHFEKNNKELIATGFEYLHSLVMIFVAQEYVISIAENISTLSGKSNSWLIAGIRRTLSRFIEEENEDNSIPNNEVSSESEKKELKDSAK